jgi:hypothetical protein
MVCICDSARSMARDVILMKVDHGFICTRIILIWFSRQNTNSWDLLLLLLAFPNKSCPESMVSICFVSGSLWFSINFIDHEDFGFIEADFFHVVYAYIESYKFILQTSVLTHCSSFSIHYSLRYNLPLSTYIIFLIFFSITQMENLSLNGESSAIAKRPNLTQAELLDLCLVGRVMVNKPVHLATLEARLGPIWEPKYQMTLILMESNKFMVQHYSKADLARILEKSPWLLDNNMIILKKSCYWGGSFDVVYGYYGNLGTNSSTAVWIYG